MAAPGILTGGHAKFFTENPTEGAAESRQGVFGNFPGATVKSARNKGARNTERLTTIARLYIELPPQLKRKAFLDSLPAETKQLGEVLINGNYGFIDFVLTNTRETFQEKTQIVNTLTDNYVAFYSGQDAPVFAYSGVVLNTYQDDQRVWLLKLYRDVLRGTRLAQRDLIASLRYDSFIVRGYLEGLTLSLDANINTAGQFQFNMRVKEMVVDTPALALPTIQVPTAVGLVPNYTNVDEYVRTDTARGATLTTEQPPSARKGPAASTDTGVYDPNAKSPVLNNAADPFSFEVAPEIAPAETDEIQQHVDQIVNEAIATINNSALGTDTTVQSQFAGLNPANVTQDGAGGLSNIKNAPADTQLAALRVRRIPTRSRGIKKVTPVQG